jgi:hypothetical protein
MQLVPEIPIVYDRHGRMQYNTMFHENMRTPWTYEDEKYLIEWYCIIGPEEMSFALERTIKSVMQRAVAIRKDGAMKKPLKQERTKKIKKEPFGEGPKVNNLITL